VSTEHFYTAKQLAGLPGMPGTVAGVLYKAGKDNWPSRQREGRGGGREYAASALPKATQKALQAQRDEVVQNPPNPPFTKGGENFTKGGEHSASLSKGGETALPCPAPAITLKEYEIRDWQRDQRDARDGVCQAIKRLMLNEMSLDRAYKLLIGQAFNAGPDSQEHRQLEQAKDARGLKKAVGEIHYPSLRSIQRWMEAGDLTPKARKKDLAVPAWTRDFLACYQQPQKPSVDAAYAEFCRHYGNQDKPSIHQVRRLLNKLPAIVREKGRMGSREIKNIKPFVRRTFEDLWPNDVWSADGHTFDSEVQNPLSGKPFRPEITSIIDIGTRKIVGFSVGLAESALSTVDALRYAISLHGVPAIFYVDNGSGYSNEMLKNEGVGLLSRFGISVKHSLPYNSQARGVIERLHRSVWVAAAKTLPSYIGADMDREAGHLNHKLTRTGDKNGVLHLALSWPNFIKLCEDAIEAYNQRSHSGLPKYVNADGKRQHYSPNAYWQHKAATLEGYSAVMVAAEDAEMLFKPRIKRTVIRGEVQLFNNKYFSKALELHHGEELQVAYDIHDADFVWIYGAEGEYICKAEWGGNEIAYFAQPVIEMKREKRSDGQIKLLTGKIADRLQERKGGYVLEAIPASELPGMEIIAKKIEERPMQENAEEAPIKALQRPMTEEIAPTIPQEDRERYWFCRSWLEKAATGEGIPENLQPFISSYPNTAKYRAMDKFYQPEQQQEPQ
jgi:putative transposase